jgi:predicted adenylyl cyclase CyaB
MLEKEIKVLNVSVSDLTAKFAQMRWFKTFEWVIHDDYYDVPGGFLDKKWYSLRIRTFDGADPHITFKIKQKHKSLKVAQEYEFATHDKAEHTFLLFQQRGLKPVRSKTKRRLSYIVGQHTFDIDMYDNMPPLLEIEWCNKKEIFTMINTLWLQDHTTLTCGYRGLCKFYEVK